MRTMRMAALACVSISVSAAMYLPSIHHEAAAGIQPFIDTDIVMAGPAPPLPVIASKFSANLRQVRGMEDFNYTYLFDADNNRSRTRTTLPVPVVKGIFKLDAITNASIELENLNDVCRVVPGGKFLNYFEFLPAAHYEGKRMIEGQLCDTWLYNSTSVIEGLAVVGNTPVEWFVKTGQEQTILLFSNVTVVESFPADAFDLPKSCSEETPLCNATQTTVSDYYVAHPDGIYSVANQDVADLLGDVVFICGDQSASHYNNYSLLSHLMIEVDPSFGQYMLCNGEPGYCIGDEPFFVGRESSLGISPDRGGQCTSNTDVGNWFSLPKDGQCGATESPIVHGSRRNQEGCTWKVRKRVKTIQLSCLEAKGMADACKQDRSVPFPTATKVFLDALNDCPDVPPPTLSLEF